ncbi:MFS transporter, partial [Streptomyces prunicolor]
MAESEDPAPSGRSPSSISLSVLFVLCAAQFMVALDFSVLNVALPTLGADLG